MASHLQGGFLFCIWTAVLCMSTAAWLVAINDWQRRHSSGNLEFSSTERKAWPRYKEIQVSRVHMYIPTGHTTNNIWTYVRRLSIFSGQGLGILNLLKHFPSPRRGTSTVFTVVNRLFVCTLACRSNIELLAAGIVSLSWTSPIHVCYPKCEV